ncbi:hypothetical protein [Pseudomonas shirazensis]|uniref:hypothetical protein n=1 Tax=Pseudomonas shirazensis TaxID=2745494 RepID=UPI003D2B80CC
MSTNAQSFNPADAVVDETDGKEIMTALLAAYAKYGQDKYGKLPADKGPRPFIEGAVVGTSSADLGINDELVADDGDGVSVIVPPYPGMKAGHTVTVAWNDDWLTSTKVTKQNEGSYLTLRVEGKKVPKGKATLRYFVFNPLTAVLVSADSTTFYRNGQPGVEGEKGRGQALAAPTVALPTSNVIGPVEASAKVKVTIPPYLSMHEADRIRLFWGNSTVDHVVTKAEVGKPIVIIVDEQMIRQAGDSTKVPVYYYVTDEVGNGSELSEEAFAHVQLRVPVVQAPALLDAEGKANTTGKINISELQSDHVVARINGQFQAGDSVLLNWNGTSSAGQEIPNSYGPEVVSKASTELTFKVPLHVIAALSGGRIRLTYTLTRSGTATTSQAAFYEIAGAPADLPAPTLNKDKNLDYQIKAEDAVVHVLIPVEAHLQEQDEVIVMWDGRTSDGNSAHMSSKMIRVSAKQVGKLLPIRLRGPQFIKPFDGGWVDIYYEVKRGNYTFYSETARYFVGEPAETLAPPLTEFPLPRNILDPDDPSYEYSVEIFIPPKEVEPTPCTVTLYWETSEGGVYEDDQVLQAGDKPSPFLVPAEHLQVKGDKPVKVWVYYVVEWADDDVPNKVSGDLIFTIATAEMLKKLSAELTVPSASKGTLDLGKVPPSGLVLEIPHYSGMAIGDKIHIKFGEDVVKIHTVTTLGKQTVTVTPAEMTVVHGKKDSVMTYEVERHPSGEKFSSQPITLKFEGSLASTTTSENFDSVRKLTWLSIGQPIEFPGLSLKLVSGIANVHRQDGSLWGPYAGQLGNVHAYSDAVVSFSLRSLARSITLTLMRFTTLSGTVRFYDINDSLIGTLDPANQTPFKTDKSKREVSYFMKLSYTSPGNLISRIEYQGQKHTSDAPFDTNIDDISWTPT